MARTFNATERARISASHSTKKLKLEIEDPDGIYRDMSTYFSAFDALSSFRLELDQDANAMTMQARLVRDDGSTASLAPLREDSTLNVDSGAAYAPFLDVGRKWRASVSVVTYGSAESYEYIGEGYIDRVIVHDPVPEVELEGRCLGALILDRWIDAEREYSSDSDMAMEDVIQDMLDDWLAGSASGVWASSGVTLDADVTAEALGDGNTAKNAWNTNSASSGAYVQVDMGTATTFDTAWIYADGAGYAGTYKVRGSNDNSSWTDLTGGGSFTPASDGWNSKSFTAASYRYWRLELTNTPGSGNWLNEAFFHDTTRTVALYTPVSPSFTMNKWTQQKQSLMTAINTVAQLAGMTVRYRYDSSDALRLTLMAPDRDATSGDEVWELGPTEYTALPTGDIDVEGVRNFIALRYYNGTELTLHPEADAASISRYGGDSAIPRVLEIDLGADANIVTSGRANTLAEAILSDLKDPPFHQVFRVPGFWIAQLGDYGKFLANDVHYDTDQYGGVTHITHEFARGEYDVTLKVRGQPSARYRGWHRSLMLRPPVATMPLICRATVTDTSDTEVEVTVAVADPLLRPGSRMAQLFGGGQGSVTITYDDGSLSTSPASGQTIAAALLTSDIDSTGSVVFTVTRGAFQSGTGRITFTATRTGRAAATDAVDVPAQERDTVELQIRATLQSASATELVYRVAVADPVAGGSGDVSIAYVDGSLSTSPASPQTIASASVTSSLDTTGTVDFTVTRPTAGDPAGRIVFTATRTGRVAAVDAGDVPAQERDFTADPIVTAEVDDDAITAAKIDVSELSAITANVGNLTVDSSTGDDITFQVAGTDAATVDSYSVSSGVETSQGLKVTVFKVGSPGTTATMRWFYRDHNTITDGGILRVEGVIEIATQTPASASAAGSAGTIAWDTNYIYVCTAADTWKRSALSSW